MRSTKKIINHIKKGNKMLYHKLILHNNKIVFINNKRVN